MIFIGWSGKFRKLLCSDGHIRKFDFDMKVVGHCDFKNQLELMFNKTKNKNIEDEIELEKIGE